MRTPDEAAVKPEPRHEERIVLQIPQILSGHTRLTGLQRKMQRKIVNQIDKQRLNEERQVQRRQGIYQDPTRRRNNPDLKSNWQSFSFHSYTYSISMSNLIIKFILLNPSMPFCLLN